MCSTCGCSGDDHHIRITEVDGSMTAHSHSHDSDHEHDHRHPDVVAEPTNETRTLHLEEQILAKNNLLAERNRGWFEARKIAAINLMSSPGSGKTTLLERTIRDLGGEVSISVIEGDQATTRDAERIASAGSRVIQVNTGNGCHLDAVMVASAVRKLDPAVGSLVVIENVGNLVCPALFDLGECARVVLMSVTEGEDKPLKYPNMFRTANLMVINKMDLLPHVSFDVARCIESARSVNSSMQILELSAISGDGLSSWYSWIREQTCTT